MPPKEDWNLRMVKAAEALALLPRLPGSDAVDWQGVTVAHLDTGYTEHPVFGDWSSGDVWLRVDDGLNLREQGEKPLDRLDYEGNPGHGTRTASILCGLSTESESASPIGVAPRLPVVPCRIVNRVVLSPEIQRERVAQGIRHAIAKACKVVSMSLGTPFFPPGTTGGMGRAVDDAYEQGIIMVAAAGQVVDKVTYPGKYDRTICAGGLTWQRRIWQDYTNGREKIDVWAPAADVLRADAKPVGQIKALQPVEGDDPGASSSLGSVSNSGGYAKGEGTSYATVHVAAAAAMWLCRHGAALSGAYDAPWQRVEAFRSLLKSTAGSINGGTTANGSGVLDIEALLLAPLPPRSGLSKAPKDKNKWA